MICRVRITHDNIFLIFIYYAKIKKIIENNQENKKNIKTTTLLLSIFGQETKNTIIAKDYAKNA